MRLERPGPYENMAQIDMFSSTEVGSNTSFCSRDIASVAPQSMCSMMDGFLFIQDSPKAANWLFDFGQSQVFSPSRTKDNGSL